MRYIDEQNDQDLKDAIAATRLTNKYAGCGPIAIISHFDFLARYAGYISIMSNPSDLYQQTALSTKVLETIDVIEGGELGTYAAYVNMYNGIESLLSYYNLATLTFNEETQDEEIVTETSPIILQQGIGYDATRFNQIKESIDNHMPVIGMIDCWETNGNRYIGHYFNIFAYEYVEITCSSGDYEEVFLQVNCNWGSSSNRFVECEFLENNSNFCKFIFFTEQHFHAYNYRYVSASLLNHYSYCTCGDSITESHSISPITNTCIECGYRLRDDTIIPVQSKPDDKE